MAQLVLNIKLSSPLINLTIKINLTPIINTKSHTVLAKENFSVKLQKMMNRNLYIHSTSQKLRQSAMTKQTSQMDQMDRLMKKLKELFFNIRVLNHVILKNFQSRVVKLRQNLTWRLQDTALKKRTRNQLLRFQLIFQNAQLLLSTLGHQLVELIQSQFFRKEFKALQLWSMEKLVVVS